MKKAWCDDGRKGKMLWAVACTCFFGCLRAGEALTPEGVQFDAKAHLAWEDVQLEDAPSPRWIRLRIKESKTDRLRAGEFVALQRTDGCICPVKSFVAEVKRALEKEGLAAEGISGHSFRIGAATAAAEGGASEDDVKALGRWKSREYRGYIRRDEGAQAASAKKWVTSLKEEQS